VSVTHLECGLYHFNSGAESFVLSQYVAIRSRAKVGDLVRRIGRKANYLILAEHPDNPRCWIGIIRSAAAVIYAPAPADSDNIILAVLPKTDVMKVITDGEG